MEEFSSFVGSDSEAQSSEVSTSVPWTAAVDENVTVLFVSSVDLGRRGLLSLRFLCSLLDGERVGTVDGFVFRTALEEDRVGSGDRYAGFFSVRPYLVVRGERIVDISSLDMFVCGVQCVRILFLFLSVFLFVFG